MQIVEDAKRKMLQDATYYDKMKKLNEDRLNGDKDGIWFEKSYDFNYVLSTHEIVCIHIGGGGIQGNNRCKFIER